MCTQRCSPFMCCHHILLSNEGSLGNICSPYCNMMDATNELSVAMAVGVNEPTSIVTNAAKGGKQKATKKPSRDKRETDNKNSDDDNEEDQQHNTRCPHLITCTTSTAADDGRTVHRFTVQPRELRDPYVEGSIEEQTASEPETSSLPAIREVICDDALKYLASITPFDQSTGQGGFGPGVSVFTSMPDITELPYLFGGYRLSDYKVWFEERAYEIFSRLQEGCHAVFLQSDVRMMNTKREVYEWLDKSHLITSAADRAGCTLVWHKLVLIKQGVDRRSVGRPSYSHLVCYVRNPPRPSYGDEVRKSYREQRKEQADQKKTDSDDEDDDGNQLLPLAKRTGSLKDMDVESAHMYSYRTSYFCVPDIFHRGEMLWARGIGLDCAYVAVMYLRDVVKCKSILDPFVGVGTVLAMANALGIHAVGVEISRKRCKRAASMTLTAEDLDRYITPSLRSIEMEVVAARRVKKEEEAKALAAKQLAEQQEEAAARQLQEKIQTLSIA